jgi:hypothetical protein
MSFSQPRVPSAASDRSRTRPRPSLPRSWAGVRSRHPLASRSRIDCRSAHPPGGSSGW